MKCERCGNNKDNCLQLHFPIVMQDSTFEIILYRFCNKCFKDLAEYLTVWQKNENNISIKKNTVKKDEYKNGFEEAKNEIIIQSIQNVRSENNKAWMDLLRLAFKSNPDQAKKIFTQITENDRKINELSKELCE